MAANPLSLYDQQPDESAPAFAAKRKYVEMGEGRSVTKVAQDYDKHRGQIGRWSKRWQWVAAAAQWDAHIADIERRAMEVERAKIARDLERLRWEQPGKEMRRAARLHERAFDLLDLPHVTRRVQDGNGQALIMPAHAAEFRAASELLRAASDIERKVLNLPTQRIAFDLSTLTTEDLLEAGRMMMEMINASEDPNTNAGAAMVSGDGSAQPASAQTNTYPVTRETPDGGYGDDDDSYPLGQPTSDADA